MKQPARSQAVAALLALSAAVLPPAAPAAAQSADAPPGVARVSVAEGNVDLTRADSGDVVAVTVNAPVNVGDYVSTEDGARAELQFENGGFIRLAEDTQTRLSDLEVDRETIQLAAGTVGIDVIDSHAVRPAVETPNLTLSPDGRGRVRVSVDADGNTFVVVRSGSATLSWPGGNEVVYAGNAVFASGSADTMDLQNQSLPQTDAFDGWNRNRDTYLAQTSSYQYLNGFIPGGADLDGNGQWVYVPAYGEVWAPTVGPGWAPYQAGSWVWQPYFGWTWVSYESWGWAPYHYGRWFYAPQIGWCWYPGPRVVQPVYAPALVGFIALTGAGFSVSFGSGGFGGIGWVPLAPNEPYRPWWGPSYVNRSTTITNVNITNITYVTNVTKVYRNYNAPRAVTGVPYNRFGIAQQPGRAYATVNTRTVQVHPFTGPVPVVPSRQSLQFTARPAAIAPPPARGFRALPAPKVRYETFAAAQSSVHKATGVAIPPPPPPTPRPVRTPFVRPLVTGRPEPSTLPGRPRPGFTPEAMPREPITPRPAPPRPVPPRPEPEAVTPRPIPVTPRPLPVTPRPIPDTPRPIPATPRPRPVTPRPQPAAAITPRPAPPRFVTPRPAPPRPVPPRPATPHPAPPHPTPEPK